MQNLFAFGDEDGKLYNAKLQHPLGVAYNHINNKVYVADTYNHKIKVIDVDTNTISTLVIKNQEGHVITFREPSGLCVDDSGSNLLVSDTNNHTIYTIDLEKCVARRFLLDFNQLPATSETDAPSISSRERGQELLKRIPLLQHKNSSLHFTIKFASDLKFTADAPQKWTIKRISPALEVKQTSGLLIDGKYSLNVSYCPENQLAGSENSNQDQDTPILVIGFSLSLCDSQSCLMKKFDISIVSDSLEDKDKVSTDPLSTDIGVYITQSNITI